MLADVLMKVAGDELASEDGAKGGAREGAITPKEYHHRPSSAGPDRCIRQTVYHSLGTERDRLSDRTALIFDDGRWLYASASMPCTTCFFVCDYLSYL